MALHSTEQHQRLTVAILHAKVQLQHAELDLHSLLMRRRRRMRSWWCRAWLTPERRVQFGLYDQLMVEFCAVDSHAFINFLRMPPQMSYSIMLVHTFRAPLEPGLKLAITLRHLASGAKYMDMHYGWRVPQNTISILVREVIIRQRTLRLATIKGRLSGLWCNSYACLLYLVRERRHL